MPRTHVCGLVQPLSVPLHVHWDAVPFILQNSPGRQLLFELLPPHRQRPPLSQVARVAELSLVKLLTPVCRQDAWVLHLQGLPVEEHPNRACALARKHPSHVHIVFPPGGLTQYSPRPHTAPDEPQTQRPSPPQLAVGVLSDDAAVQELGLPQ